MRVDGFENRPRWPAMQWCQGACGDVKLELPWPLKPLHSVGSKVFESKFGSAVNNLSRSRQVSYNRVAPGGFRVSNLTLNHFQAQIQSLTTKFGQWGKNDVKERSSPPLSPEEQGDAEERALALALASRPRATLLEFYSPRCTLCKSLMKVVQEIEQRDSSWLRIVMADVENKKWLPEAIQYEINYVPCFVLLDSQGTALAKTGVPHSRLHVLKGLSYLLESMRPIRGGLQRSQKTSNKNPVAADDIRGGEQT